MMLQRDPHSRAIVSTDAAALNKYKQERALHKKVNFLEKEVSECKEALKRVCERLEQIESE